MKKKTVYIWMSIIVGLSVALFAAIYFFNLQSKVKPIVASIDRNGPPVFIQAIYGDFSKPLTKPMDVTKVGEYIYVTDANGKQVQVFDQSGTPIFQFGKDGSGKGEFKFPYGITGDEKGNVYVADLYNGKISIFDEKGKFVQYFKEAKDPVIVSPGGLRIYNNKLYVTDIKENKVFIFDLKGKKLQEIGGPGSNDGQFIAPNAITIDRDNQIYVTDSGNNRVQIFDEKGKFLRIINGSKNGKGQSSFLNPRGVGVDSKGDIYIVNNMSHSIFSFDRTGKQLATFGGMGTDNNSFYLPNGLFIDKRGTMYITDTVNRRVCIYN